MAASGPAAVKKDSQSNLAASGKGGNNRNAGCHFPDYIPQNDSSRPGVQDHREVPNLTLSTRTGASTSCLKNPIEEVAPITPSGASAHSNDIHGKEYIYILEDGSISEDPFVVYTAENRLVKWSSQLDDQDWWWS